MLERRFSPHEDHEECLPVQVFLVWKIIIEGCWRHIHHGCDIAYRDDVIASGSEEFGCGLHDGDLFG